MVRATFPSRTAPGLPAFSIDTPADWTVVPASGALLAVVGPSAPGAFRPNITVATQRDMATASIDEVADALLLDIKTATGELKLAGDWSTEVASQPARWQEFAFVEPLAATTLFQVQVCLFAPFDDAVEVKDLIQIHATCAGDQAPALHRCLRDTIQSLRFDAV